MARRNLGRGNQRASWEGKKAKEKVLRGNELGKTLEPECNSLCLGDGEELGKGSNLRLEKLEGQNVFIRERILEFILRALGNHQRALSVDVTKSCSCL